MDKFLTLFCEYMLKAITLTEEVLVREIDAGKLELFTANRERLFQVIDHISRQVDWTSIDEETRSELNRQIDYLKKLDEKLVVKLQEHQMEVKKEIEATHRSKENIKGYNLSDVK